MMNTTMKTIKTEENYETRATPRKRVKTEDESYDKQPAFLRKTYNLFCTSPTDIGDNNLK
jgi:hypothetical protein